MRSLHENADCMAHGEPFQKRPAETRVLTVDESRQVSGGGHSHGLAHLLNNQNNIGSTYAQYYAVVVNHFKSKGSPDG